MYSINQNNFVFHRFAIILILLGLVTNILCEAQVDELFQKFNNPPKSSQPRTWWHWTKGNVTLDGITKDLEWMKRVGIAGFQLADVNFGGGQIVEDKILFGSSSWYDALYHTAKEAERLDLEMAIFSSPGWSITGGPWVKPDQAMKKIVYADTTILGGRKITIKLPQPPFNNGPIQDFNIGNDQDPTFYNDIAVYAYRLSEFTNHNQPVKPKVTSNFGLINSEALNDNNFNSTVTLERPEGVNKLWLLFEYDKPFTARSFTISAKKGIPIGSLQASKDGVEFINILSLPGPQLYRQGWSRTFSIPETVAKFYRLDLTGAPLNPSQTMNQNPDVPAPEYILSEVKLDSIQMINRWEEKAGNRHLFEYESVSTNNSSNSYNIEKDDFIELTSKMDTNGILNWEVPDGYWKILRLGFSLTGAKNRPPVPEGLGFEVDKLSRKHTMSYLDGYLNPIKEKLGPLYGKTLNFVMLDSWEAGMQNWTDNMIEEFVDRRGYCPKPYLPTLAGHIVYNEKKSDRFLWDFRRTLADMFAENHYGVISEYLDKEGIGTYGEASGVSLEILEDALLCKKFMDIPMGEFWVRDLHPSSMYYEDIRGAASAAHVYGKDIVAAESFTGGGYESPFKLKKIADYWFCQGINRLVFHTSAHQPYDFKPGNTMVGTHLNRNITWAEQAKPFMEYLSRISFMLQQGKFAADIAYLLNEGAPSSMPIWGDGLTPKPPEGYDFDYINTDVLLNRISVDKKGNLILPDGMTYRILVLPQIEKMTLPVLEKIHDLVIQGATIVGPKPEESPSLIGYPEVDFKIKQLASEIWGDLNGISRNRRTLDKGNVFWGLSLEHILKILEIPVDVEYSKPLDMELHWIHRSTNDKEIYFLVNSSEKSQKLEIRFRVKDKIPKLWEPDTGVQKKVDYIIKDNFTTVSLKFPQYGSCFVIFDDNNDVNLDMQETVQNILIKNLNNDWKLTFPKNMTTPEEITTDQLKPWSKFSEEGIKYFSGTATYHNTFIAEDNLLKTGSKIYLDLGQVNDIARVTLNEKEIGTIWKAPYNLDITEFICAGENRLKIEVTNQWTNRILGDLNEDVHQKVLKVEGTSIHFFGPKPLLPESGLIGPVNILAEQK